MTRTTESVYRYCIEILEMPTWWIISLAVCSFHFNVLVSRDL